MLTPVRIERRKACFYRINNDRPNVQVYCRNKYVRNKQCEMSLSQILGSYGSDSDSDSEKSFPDQNDQKCSVDKKEENASSCSFFAEPTSSDDEDEEIKIKNENLEKISILPKPDFSVSQKFPTTSIGQRSGATSIFENSFSDAEKTQCDILERHVKMSEKNPSFLDHQRKIKKSKLLCLMYKKGRCIYTAEQCRFSHTVGEKLIERLIEEKSVPVVEVEESPSVYEESCVEYNEQEIEIKHRKKRPGVNDKLEPPKKAMQLFDKQRNVEAPWLYK